MRPLKTIGAYVAVSVVLATGLSAVLLAAQTEKYTGTIDYGVRVQDKEVVLFPFDNYAIPFRSGLQLSLVSSGRSKSPVLRPGDAGQPDSGGAAFYGTVIPFGNQLRMWYLCAGSHESAPGFSWLPNVRFRVCYATSTDGTHWEKPDLGLVEYNGSTHNNIVKLNSTGSEPSASIIIYDPEDPNPGRRFKMIYENYGGIPNGECSAAFSGDGLTWTNSPLNPVIKVPLEPSGLIKYNGLYYVIGHGARFSKRLLAVHPSADFEHWADAASVGLRRDEFGPLHPHVMGEGGEQIHLGAALWDRGNVILGLYGQWHGPSPESNDRRDLTMDIGLVVSHDALHYYEPLPDFKMIEGGGVRFSEIGFRGRLVQGQGFLNWGDKTVEYYSLWGPGGADGVWFATWGRDRLGYYSVPAIPSRERKPPDELRPDEGQMPMEGVTSNFVSCPIWIDKPRTKVYVNAEGLGEYSKVTVEVLDDKFNGIKEYSEKDSIPLTNSGLHEQVTWRNGESLPKFDHSVRIRVSFSGLQLQYARVYAVYLK